MFVNAQVSNGSFDSSNKVLDAYFTPARPQRFDLEVEATAYGNHKQYFSALKIYTSRIKIHRTTAWKLLGTPLA